MSKKDVGGMHKARIPYTFTGKSADNGDVEATYTSLSIFEVIERIYRFTDFSFHVYGYDWENKEVETIHNGDGVYYSRNDLQFCALGWKPKYYNNPKDERLLSIDDMKLDETDFNNIHTEMNNLQTARGLLVDNLEYINRAQLVNDECAKLDRDWGQITTHNWVHREFYRDDTNRVAEAIVKNTIDEVAEAAIQNMKGRNVDIARLVDTFLDDEKDTFKNIYGKHMLAKALGI